MSGLDEVLNLLRDRLDADLEATLQERLTKPGVRHVLVANPFKADGSAVPDTDRSVLLTLAGVHLARAPRPPTSPLPGRGPKPPPGATLTADVLVTANLQRNYHSALTKLALVVASLESNPVLVADGRPPRDDTPIRAEFVDLGVEEAAALVAQTGVMGMPYALYRLRGISLES